RTGSARCRRRSAATARHGQARARLRRRRGDRRRGEPHRGRARQLRSGDERTVARARAALRQRGRMRRGDRAAARGEQHLPNRRDRRPQSALGVVSGGTRLRPRESSMRKLLICAAAAAATLVGPLSLQAPSAQSSTIARVIVKYRADSTLLRKQALSVAGQQTLQASALGNRIGIALDAGRAISDRSHVIIGRGMTSQQLAARLAAQSDIEYAVPDERKRIVEVPTDPFYASGPAVGPTSGGPAVGQWYLKPPAAASTAAHTAPAAINAEKAWDITKGSASIVVAVLDTGLRFDHPDLQGGNVLPGYDMISADSPGDFTSANDGNGRDADASDPGDFVTAADSTALGCAESNSSWHGTQTLGLIGATTNNGVG